MFKITGIALSFAMLLSLIGTPLVAAPVQSAAIADSLVVSSRIVQLGENQPPVGVQDDYTTPEDTAATGNVLLNDSDPEGDTITASLMTPPLHGTLMLQDNGNFAYTPAANYVGWDTWNYEAHDATGCSAPVLVVMTMTAVNDLPTGVPDVYDGLEDTTLSGNVLENDTDVDGDDLTINTLPAVWPSHGWVQLQEDGSFAYHPNANWNGTDSFSYQVCDGEACTGSVVVTLNVAPQNDTPIAQPDSYEGQEDTPLSGCVLDNDSDPDGDTVVVALSISPEHGDVQLDNDTGDFTYWPDLNWYGTDTFIYRLSDSALTSEPATVTLEIASVNDRPLAVNDIYTITEDSVASGCVFDNDSDDSASFTMQLDSSPVPMSMFSSNLNTGTFSYTPLENWYGTTSFQYHLYDGRLESLPATVTLVVEPVNDAPVALPDSYSCDEDGSISGLVMDNDSDVDGDELSVSLVQSPHHGGFSFKLLTGSFKFTPLPDWNGTTEFSYQLSDGEAVTDPVTVTLTVNPVNDAPVIDQLADCSYTSGDPVRISVICTDPDGDATTLSAAGLPQGLSLNADTGIIGGTLADDAEGDYTVAVRAGDGQAMSEMSFGMHVAAKTYYAWVPCILR